jgi:DNA polymerase II
MSDAPATITGWLLDLYADPQGELALWLLEDADDCCKGRSGHEHAAQNGRIPTRPYNDIPRRLRLRQAFPISFYAAGPGPRLRLLWQHLARLHPQLIAQGLLTLSRQERRDLFEPEPVTVLAVEVQKPGLLPGLFQRAAAAFPDLTYYDADLPLSARHAAVHGTFPLAKLRLEVTVSGAGVTTVQALQTLDSPWDLDPPPPPLRVMHLSPDCDPRRGVPAWLEVQVATDPKRLSEN